MPYQHDPHDPSTADTAKLNRGAVRRQGRRPETGDGRHPTPRTGAAAGTAGYVGYNQRSPRYGGDGMHGYGYPRSSRQAQEKYYGVAYGDARQGETRVRRTLARDYGKAAIVGAVIGILVAAVLTCLLGGYPAMWERRSSIAVKMADNGGSVGPCEWHGDQPAISWGLLYEDEELVTRASLIDDIVEMTDADAGFGLFSWPAIPYFVGEGHESDCYELMKIVDGIYSDYPELSVYTNGQCVQTAVAGARYMLPASVEATPEENKEEYEAVKAKIDEWAKNCSSVAGTDDALYVMEAYRTVCENCVYAPDDDDSPHANDIYGAIFEGKTRCYGGSSALKAFLDRRGIPSFIASGQVHGNPAMLHAWNVVWYDGGWYACDTTCAMGARADTDNAFYWDCMRPLTRYMELQDIMMDPECKELMKAYEELLGVEAREVGSVSEPEEPPVSHIATVSVEIPATITYGESYGEPTETKS